MKTAQRFFLCLALVWTALVPLSARSAEAKYVRLTLSASGGFGYEVHPVRHVQAENVMLALGAGFLGDIIRFEMGAVTAYGALWGTQARHVHVEFRPMLRFGLPLLPLYARLVFAGLNPFAQERNIAYGAMLGVNIPLKRVGLFAEAGALPRRAQQQMHWVLEGRLGVSWRL